MLISDEMAMRKPVKRAREPPTSSGSKPELPCPDIALAAIAPYKKQKEVSDFINYLLSALERNSAWLNNIVQKQIDFRCALLSGAGPNRFQMQEIIYPATKEGMKLEVELRDSEDHDKIAVAAIIKLGSPEIDKLMKYIKTKLYENTVLQQDLLKGKSLGISFALLKPFADKHFRIVDRITIGGSYMKYIPPIKKKRQEFTETAFKKFKRIT